MKGERFPHLSPFISLTDLGCGLASRRGLAGFHLALEPVDLVLDRLPSRLGREPTQRTSRSSSLNTGEAASRW